MAYEFIDLKGLLFVVLLSIPLTSSANIDCGGKPFHCLNSTHFMICVDLGGGLSTTIDDFVIPCPPPTMCHKDNKFECEFPKIEETTTPHYTIGIPEENKKSVLPQAMDNPITIQPPVETTIVSTVTEQNTASQLPTLEETSPFINEVLENLKEEFATGNEKFFEGDTTKQSTTTVSSSYSIDEIKIKGPTIYDLTSTTENDNNLKLKSEPLTAYAVETTETVIPKLIDSNPSADVIPTVSTNVLKDNSSIQIGLHLTSDTTISDLFKFNQTKQNNTNEPNRTLDVLVKNLVMPTSLLPFSVDKSPMIDKHSGFNRTNYVVSLQNSSTPATLIESVIENTINALNHSEIVFETSSNYNDRNNIEFHIEPKDNNSFIDEHINQNLSKVVHNSQEFSTEIPKSSHHENMTSNQNLFSPMEITTTKLPTIIFNDNGINNLSEVNTKVSSDIILNQNAFNNTPVKDGNDISTIANAEINKTNNFNDDISNIIINMTHVDLNNKLPELVTKEEAITNDFAHFIDKPSITEYTTTSDFVPSTNFKQPQTSKLGTTTFQTTISDKKQTFVTDSLTTRIDDQVILPENNFTSNPLIENSTRSSALEDALTYFSSITEESVKITPLHHTYEETTTLPIENITIEVVESTLSLPASNKDAIQNITPAPKFTAIASYSSTTGNTNGNNLIITGGKNNATKTESEKKISLTMIDSNSNNTVLIASNYWQNLTTLDLNSNTTVNKSHIAVSELSKLTTTGGSYNVDNIVMNDTFINYIEDLNASKSDLKNISMKADAGTTQHVGNVPQLQKSVNVPIFAVQNDSMNLEPFTNVNINNNLDEKNKTFFMNAVQDKKTYQSEQVVHSSTIVNVIKPQRPEYVTESILLSELSTEASLPTATVAGPKIINYVKRNMLSQNSKPDIVNTKISKKPTYTNIPNNIVVSPMRTNIESQNLAHDPILHQVTPLPHKSVTSNKLGISKTKAVSNLTVYQNRSNTAATINNTNKNTSSSFNCPNITRGKYADSKDCRKFYTCLGKLQPISGICPNNTVFSEINKLCTRNLSHCVRNNQFHCVYEGRFSDLLKDNIFYICVKNKSRTFVRYTLRCTNGYHLNKATAKCEHNTEKNESANSNSNISNDTNGSLVNSDTSEKSDFECKDEGKFPILKDCRKYYECTKNSKDEYRRKIKTCASEEMYDSKKKKCVPSESEEC